MASTEEKMRIRKYASEGKSVNWIRDKLDLPKSTVYYHFKKEVGQKQKENQPTIPDEDDFKGELCGIFAGDGSFFKSKEGEYKTRVHLNWREEYWRILKDYLTKKTG